ncbi:Hypothetical predicted protein [Mytilus galloprovincialis]|uniref:Uncharacterized protein n=1 Tax=Mytilus galloprovincialis TaxID=29158 RepID=A0A8B6BY93_MYTGA|nr:Hypothetical predicted protein [Mytilus galloprovincialis]
MQEVSCRCNNVHGCIDITHTSTETSSGGSSEIFTVTTVSSIITSTYKGYSEQTENSTDLASTYSVINTSEHETTVFQNRKKRTQETVKISYQGLLEREIFVYSLCAAGFTLCIVVCVACFCCKTLKRRKAVDINVREENNENMNISDHNLLGSYDFIDEDTMLQISSIVKTRTESIKSSNSYSFTGSTNSDGYLDPIPIMGISHSNTSKSESDIKNETSSDIHPYQTIDHHPVEISHEYTRCGVVPGIELVDIGRSRKNGNSSNGGFQRRQIKYNRNLNNEMNINKYHQSESDLTKCTKNSCPSKKCRSSY